SRGDDEEIDRVGKQGQPQYDLEGARAEQEPEPRRGEDADGERENDFHQTPPSGARACGSSSAFLLSGERIDWCASAIRIRTVVPTTTAKTPMSNSRALAIGISPISGIAR